MNEALAHIAVHCPYLESIDLTCEEVEVRRLSKCIQCNQKLCH
jgi:hypothetical protein